MKELDPLLKGLENIVWWAVNVMKCPYQIGDRVEVRTPDGIKQGAVISFMMKRIDDMAFFLEIECDDGEKLTPKRPVDIVRKIDSPPTRPSQQTSQEIPRVEQSPTESTLTTDD
jgi:hypothetical protein